MSWVNSESMVKFIRIPVGWTHNQAHVARLADRHTASSMLCRNRRLLSVGVVKRKGRLTNLARRGVLRDDRLELLEVDRPGRIAVSSADTHTIASHSRVKDLERELVVRIWLLN